MNKRKIIGVTVGTNINPQKLSEYVEDGKSAYELAVEHGFKGTEKEWVASLNGKDGVDGRDGYTPVKGVDYFDGKDGYTPVKGVDYFDGTPGKDGQDGYTPVKGKDYFDGINGQNGVDGVGIEEIYFNDDDEMIISMTDGSVKNLGKVAADIDVEALSTNMQKGTGTNATQQLPDGVAAGFSFSGKNANAATYDETVAKWNAGKATVPYGATGDYASAFGGKSAAIGKRSHAEGTTTIAKGAYSHAEGDNTVTLGSDSHAEGLSTVSKGNQSHAEGSYTIAEGGASHAEGSGTKSIGMYAHAEGENSESKGQAAHAEGKSTAEGNYAHSEGAETKAIGRASHSEGLQTEAHAVNSHAEGYSSKVYGEAAHVEGYGTSAEGLGAHAEGNSTLAVGANSHTEGANTKASGTSAHAEGYRSFAKGNYSHAEGYSETANNLTITSVTNLNDSSTGDPLDAARIFSIANGQYSHNEGVNTVAWNNATHAEGRKTLATGIGSHAEGSLTTSNGHYSHTEGENTIANGQGAHAEGMATRANGAYSHTEGDNTTANGRTSHAEGQGTIASTNNQHVQGRYNIEDTAGKYAHIVGNGEENNIRSNAHTVDWSGNAWFSGEVKVGGTSADSSDAKVLVTKEVTDELQRQINAIQNDSIISDLPQLIEGFARYIEENDELAEEFRTDINQNAADIADLESKVANISISWDDLTDKPFGELSEEESFVAITYNPIQSSPLNPDAYWHLVSYDTFSTKELTDNDAPFYVDIRDSADGYTMTHRVSDSKNTYVDNFDNVMVLFSHSTQSGSGSVIFYVINDYQNCTFSTDTSFPSNGVYFVDDSALGASINRLYRTDKVLRKLDSKYLDLDIDLDLTEHVKFTDYAGEGKAGVIKANNQYSGTYISADGSLSFYGLEDEEWDGRNTEGYYASNRVIKADMVDMAVKVGLTKNSKSLSDNEKASARAWLGVPTTYDGLKDKPFYGKAPIALTCNFLGTIPETITAYLQTEKTYLVSDLLGATVSYRDGSSMYETTTLSNSHIYLETSDGVAFKITSDVYIFVAYSNSFATGIVDPLVTPGVYFTYFDDGDPYEVVSITKEGTDIKKLDNIYLDLENNDYLNNKLGDIEAALDNKQDELSFDGEYDAETNKIATVQTVVDKIAEIDMGSTSTGTGLSETIKDLLLQLFKRAVYTDDCKEYIKALEDEFTNTEDSGDDSGGDSGDDEITVEVPEGYTLVRTIDGSELSVWKNLGVYYPYYQDKNTRTAYLPFDISITGGSYKPIIETADGVALKIGYQAYTEKSLESVNAQTNMSSTYLFDSGWVSVDEDILIPTTVNGSPIVGVRMSFSRLDDSPMQVSDIICLSLFKKNASTVEVPEGYTLVRTIEEQDLSVGKTLNLVGGEYSKATSNRAGYVPFDTHINGGIYNAIVETAEGVEVNIAYRVDNEKALESVASSATIATDNFFGSGWKTPGEDVIIPEMIAGSPTAAVRVVFKRTDNATIQAGDIKAVHIIKSNNALTDGYTLVHTIEENELSVATSLKHASPYYAAYSNRTSYVPFDLSLEGGTYMVILDTVGGDGREFVFAFQCYNQIIYDKQTTGASWVLDDLYGTDFTHSYAEFEIPETYNGSPIIGARITIREDPEKAMVAGNITRIRIYKKEV